jgi:arylsulfatase A-like enzyme
LLPWFRRISARYEYDVLLQAASRVVADSPADFIFVHLSVPHVPPLYNAETGTHDLFILRSDWYEDNLRLADITLGILRRQMEQAGRWDDSTIIVTSDHQYRLSAEYDGKTDPRMPVIVKLPHQQAPVPYDKEFHAKDMFGLVTTLFQQDVHEPGQLTEWLAREHAAAPETH